MGMMHLKTKKSFIFNSPKTKINQVYIQGFSWYSGVKKHRLGYKTNHLIPYRQITSICFEIRIVHINTLYGQKGEFENVKILVVL